MTDYNVKTRLELSELCKERGIRGYAGNKITKDGIIELLKKYDAIDTSPKDAYDNMKYDDLLALCRKRKIKCYFGRSSTGKVVATKEMMIKALEDHVVRINLFDYLTENNPSIISKFVGNPNDLKEIHYIESYKKYN